MSKTNLKFQFKHSLEARKVCTCVSFIVISTCCEIKFENRTYKDKLVEIFSKKMSKFRSKLKRHTKGAKWARGQSATSNPQNKKHRNAARSRFFQPNLNTGMHFFLLGHLHSIILLTQPANF